MSKYEKLWNYIEENGTRKVRLEIRENLDEKQERCI